MTTPGIPISTEGGQADYAPPTATLQLPFTFAKHHGVLLDAEVDPPLVLYQTLPPVAVLTELRRFLGAKFDLQACEAGEFQKRL